MAGGRQRTITCRSHLAAGSSRWAQTCHVAPLTFHRCTSPVHRCSRLVLRCTPRRPRAQRQHRAQRHHLSKPGRSSITTPPMCSRIPPTAMPSLHFRCAPSEGSRYSRTGADALAHVVARALRPSPVRVPRLTPTSRSRHPEPGHFVFRGLGDRSVRPGLIKDELADQCQDPAPEKPGKCRRNLRPAGWVCSSRRCRCPITSIHLTRHHRQRPMGRCCCRCCSRC